MISCEILAILLRIPGCHMLLLSHCYRHPDIVCACACVCVCVCVCVCQRGVGELYVHIVFGNVANNCSDVDLMGC